MPRKTKFSALWFNRTIDGEKIAWCDRSSNDDFAAFCKVCQKDFSIANMGFGQIVSHMKSNKHQNFMKANQTQCKLVAKSNLSQDKTLQLSGPSNRHWIPRCLEDKIVKAEAVILLTAMKCNYSFSSINELTNILPAAFDDSEIAKNLKLGDTKARYVVKFGLAPYFKKLIFSDILSSSSYFTIYFDETTTKQVKKQLDLYISYWSEKFERIITFYVESFFLGHAESDKIFKLILDFMTENGLPLDKLLNCSMDGPNVNLSLQKMLNAHLDQLNIPNMISIGTCSLHVVHNATKKGISELDCDIENFVLNIFQWFHSSAARREDYHEVQLAVLLESASDHVFQRYVESRWLTLGPVCERIIEQYPALKEYFIETVPKKNVHKGVRYVPITKFLNDPVNLIYLHFTVFFANSFKSYMTLFQSESPMIHCLFLKQNELLRSLMMKFIKTEIVSHKGGLALANLDCKNGDFWIPLKKIEIGCAAKKLLNYPEHKGVLNNIRSVYIVTCQYLQSKLSLSNPLLQDLQYIHPMGQTDIKAKEGVDRLVNHLIKITKTDVVCDIIKSEYLIYMSHNLSNQKEVFSKDNNICKYWAEISKMKDPAGNPIFKSLCHLVKSCLTISHGNSIPERGFSTNSSIVTAQRSSLSEKGIRSIRLCKDYVRHVGTIPALISKEMIDCIKKSHAEYSCYLEQIKSEKKVAANKRKIDDEEEEKKKVKNEIFALRNEEEEILKNKTATYSLINEASDKLRTAVKNNDFNSVKVAQMMLDVANSNLKEINVNLKTVKEKINNAVYKANKC